MSTTRDDLGIFWHFPDGQDEVDGMMIYGCWLSDLLNKHRFDDFCECWPNGKIEYDVTRLDYVDGRRRRAVFIAVRILEWPNQQNWLYTVERCLRYMIQRGAVVAWCGDEYSSCSPDIFYPPLDSCRVYAAYSRRVGFVYGSDLDEEHRYLAPDELRLFWEDLGRSEATSSNSEISEDE